MTDQATGGVSKHPRWQVERRVSGRAAAADKRYNAKRPPRAKQARTHLAHARCKKYGVRLKFFQDLGWYPDDVREALNGHS